MTDIAIFLIAISPGALLLVVLGFFFWRDERKRRRETHMIRTMQPVPPAQRPAQPMACPGPARPRLVLIRCDDPEPAADDGRDLSGLGRLSSAMRRRLAARWRTVLMELEQHPSRAIEAADRVIEEALEARGCPVTPTPRPGTNPPPHSSKILREYLEIRRLARRHRRRLGELAEEELLAAMDGYRDLFQELVAADFRVYPGAVESIEEQKAS